MKDVARDRALSRGDAECDHAITMSRDDDAKDDGRLGPREGIEFEVGVATTTTTATAAREKRGRSLAMPRARDGASPKRRRGRPPAGAKGGFSDSARALGGREATGWTRAAYAEMVTRSVMMYHVGLMQESMRRAAMEAHARAFVVSQERARGGGGTGGAPEAQKQWPIVPQVSTAICPPRRDSLKPTPPGAFGKREAVNAGVQEANAAKTKANAARAALRVGGVDEASRSSRDDRNAAVAKRVQEAKFLLDPSKALDANALANEVDSDRTDASRRRVRARRSSAPSPESSLGARRDPGDDGQPAGSEAHGSKGSEKESKSAAAA